MKKGKQKNKAIANKGLKNNLKAKKRVASRVEHTVNNSTWISPFQGQWGRDKHINYITEVGRAAMLENKNIKTKQKDLVEILLAKFGYNKDVFYTCKEKKVFTRKVRDAMYPKKQNAVTLTPEQYKEKFAKEKQDKLERLESRPHISTINKDYEENKRLAKEFLQNYREEKKKSVEDTTKKKYRYSVQRLSDDITPKNIDFLTEYLYAEDDDSAKKALITKASKYKDMDGFAGVKLVELKEDNSEGNIYMLPASAIAA